MGCHGNIGIAFCFSFPTDLCRPAHHSRLSSLRPENQYDRSTAVSTHPKVTILQNKGLNFSIVGQKYCPQNFIYICEWEDNNDLWHSYPKTIIAFQSSPVVPETRYKRESKRNEHDDIIRLCSISFSRSAPKKFDISTSQNAISSVLVTKFEDKRAYFSFKKM